MTLEAAPNEYSRTVKMTASSNSQLLPYFVNALLRHATASKPLRITKNQIKQQLFFTQENIDS